MKGIAFQKSKSHLCTPKRRSYHKITAYYMVVILKIFLFIVTIMSYESTVPVS